MENVSDEELAKTANALPPEKYIELLTAADDAARAAKHYLNVITKVGLERTDVTRQQMADALGVDRRTVHKRRHQL